MYNPHATSSSWRLMVVTGLLLGGCAGETPLAAATTPAAPTTLTIIPATSQVLVTWCAPTDDGGGVANYQVEYKATTEACWANTARNGSTANWQLVTGLVNGTTYEFRVKAVGKGGIGTVSATVAATPSPAATPAPVLLARFDGTCQSSYGSIPCTMAGTAVLRSEAARGGILETSSGAVDYALPLPASFTKAAWVRLHNHAKPGTHHILSGFGGGDDVLCVSQDTGGGAPALMSLRAGVAEGGNAKHVVWNPVTFPSATWVHVALSFDGATKRYVLYQNAQMVAIATAARSPVNQAGISVGAFGDRAWWNGVIDDAGLWNAVLTPAQIVDVYAGTFARSTPAAPPALNTFPGDGRVLVSWTAPPDHGSAISDYVVECKASTDTAWRVVVDGTSTATRATVTGLANGRTHEFRVSAVNAQGRGAASAVAACTPAAASIPAPVLLLRFNGDTLDDSRKGIRTINMGITFAHDAEKGMVGRFDGGSQWVHVACPLPASFSKAAWVQAAIGSGMSNRHIISHGVMNGYGGSNAQMFWVDGGLLNAACQPAGRTIKPAVDGGIFPVGTWVHVGMTYDAATRMHRVYRDGALVASGTCTGAIPASPCTNIGVWNGPGTFWSGSMKDAAMWDRVLSDAEMGLVYAGNLGVDGTVTVPGAPQQLIASPAGPTSVMLGWSWPAGNGHASITGFSVEYRPTGGSAWTRAADGPAHPHATITGLKTGTAYEFRVGAINAAGTGQPGGIASTTPMALACGFILSSGQSLSVGAGCSPPLSTLPHGDCSLSGGPGGSAGPLIPLVESGVETPSSGMAGYLRAYARGGAEQATIIGVHGVGGWEYAKLKKGTGPYKKGLTQLATARDLALAAGNRFRALGVTLFHGEADHLLGNFTQYEGYLAEWQKDYQTDVNAITGDSSVLPVFINQMNSSWTSEIALAQYRAHKHHPGRVILAAPKYQYVYGQDAVHLTNITSKAAGEMLGKVIRLVALEGRIWNPLMPTTVVRSGRIITIAYHIPVGALVLDTTLVVQRPDYGFEFLQTGGSAPCTITAVQLVDGGTKVQITLSGVPDGTDQKVRYAARRYAGYIPGTMAWSGGAANPKLVGGNLRDSDAATVPAPDGTGLPLYNWGVAFEEEVSALPTSPASPQMMPTPHR